jgi:phospholipid transport system substrate-binding protein
MKLIQITVKNRNNSFFTIGLSSLIFVALLSINSLWAGPTTDFLKQKVKQVRTLASKPCPNQKSKDAIDAELLTVIAPLMNFPKMSKATLGKFWKTADASQQKRFVSLFQDLVFHTYMKKIRSAKNDYTIQYEDERKEGKLTIIDSLITKKKAEFELGFHMQAIESTYEVADVIIDEVSLVENYREQFTKIIKKEGFDGLLKKMQTQLDKVKS